MPLVVYSVLRLALFGACWAALTWAGLNAWIAAVLAAFVAWGLSYAALPGPRDAAARWLADRDARRRSGASMLSARAQRDAADEDALVESRDDAAAPDEPGSAAAPDRPGAAPPPGAAAPAATPGEPGPARAEDPATRG